MALPSEFGFVTCIIPAINSVSCALRKSQHILRVACEHADFAMKNSHAVNEKLTGRSLRSKKIALCEYHRPSVIHYQQLNTCRIFIKFSTRKAIRHLREINPS
jgi:TRAP-type mannitol/chloroaromatic compound transport system substrate-binding protein